MSDPWSGYDEWLREPYENSESIPHGRRFHPASLTETKAEAYEDNDPYVSDLEDDEYDCCR